MEELFTSTLEWAMTEGGLAWVVLGFLVVGLVVGYFTGRGKVHPVQQTFNIGTIEPGEEQPVSSTTIRHIEAISEANYQALENKDDNTIYVISSKR